MTDKFRMASLLAATMTTGIAAGVFQLYTYAIMPGLRSTDDATFVRAFQEIDGAIINPWWFFSFFGALVFTGLSAGLTLRAGQRSALYWIVGAFAVYLAVVVVTIAVHVPLNDEIKAAGDAGGAADFAAIRDEFHESRWVAWNIFRAVGSTIAFGCLAWALVLDGLSVAARTPQGAAAEEAYSTAHGGATNG